MVKISEAFSNLVINENGDLQYNTTGSALVDLIFFAPKLSKTPNLADGIFNNVEEDLKLLLSAFIRDPRFGLGYKDLGRHLLEIANADPETISKVGRFDDLWKIGGIANIDYLYKKVLEGNALAKKWCPRFGSKNKADASMLAKMWNLNKQSYGKFVKCDTVERMLTEKNYDAIDFGKLPSLAAIKYAPCFSKKEETSERYAQYREAVKNGEANLNVATTTPYDIFKNRDKIDPDMFFDRLPKISLSCMCVVDTSGSMWDENDSIGKALAIGHYLSMCSTYENGKIVTFSSEPQIIDLNGNSPVYGRGWNGNKVLIDRVPIKFDNCEKSKYAKQVSRMYTGDCSNTDLGAVMDLLSRVDELPEYLVVLSDMQFDRGSGERTRFVEQLWKRKGYKTKIVWWNFNDRGMTAPEMDNMGNIFISGYSPMLLQYLETGFDAQQFGLRLLQAYAENLKKAQ